MSETCSCQHNHGHGQQGKVKVAFAIVTVSDSRSESSDANGRFLRDAVAAAGHQVCDYRLIQDEAEEIERALKGVKASGARVVIFNGGTGIARRDRTSDVLFQNYDKMLPGFGEIFRLLSYEAVGPAAMLSRASAGVIGVQVVFSLPGSPQAVEMAWKELIAPQVRHIAALLE